MKRALITSLIAVLLAQAPAFAEDLPTQTGKADLTASATPVKEATPDPSAQSMIKKLKTEPLVTRKQKIETELRATIVKLGLVIDRTQVLITLLNKNGKDTGDSASALLDARSSLEEATIALDQFAGVVVPSEKIETKLETKEVSLTDKPIKSVVAKEVQLLKDPLKKTQDSLKASKASLIESITSLKDALSPKDDGQ